MIKSNQNKPIHDENILVVPRIHLFPHGIWHGFNPTNFNEIQTIINEKKEFHPRYLMEENSLYKQIIPYIIFTYENSFFLMQRTPDANAIHLRNKFTLGIGGHICQKDVTNDSLFSWALREFHEEVDYTDPFTITELGIINDDSYEQGTKHIGFVFLMQGTSAAIKIKSELKNGKLASSQECIEHENEMETWSKHLLDYLKELYSM